jgi:hypothetical protein
VFVEILQSVSELKESIFEFPVEIVSGRDEKSSHFEETYIKKETRCTQKNQNMGISPLPRNEQQEHVPPKLPTKLLKALVTVLRWLFSCLSSSS